MRSHPSVRQLLIGAMVVVTLLALAVLAQASTRREFSGAWYAEALPNGVFAVAMKDGRVVTNTLTAPAPAPGERVLYLRIDRTGSRFAGQSQTGQVGSWQWTGAAWVSSPNVAFGVSGLIYDAANTLVYAVPGVTGSQGFRYVEDGTGRLVTGDDTYADATRRIWEFTTHGDITVGQGERGCLALTETDMVANGVRVLDRRLIEPGDCRFVRFNRSGDQLAIAMVKLPEDKTVLLWLTAAELSTFPPETAAPLPVPAQVPAAEIARAQAALGRVAFAPNTPTLPILAHVAMTLGRPWGLNGKRGNPLDPSRDVLAWDWGPGTQPQLYDVVVDAWDPATGLGANLVVWSALVYPQPAGAVWVNPAPYAGVPMPLPDPPPLPDSPQVAALKAHVRALEVELALSRVAEAHALQSRERAVVERDAARVRVEELAAHVEILTRRIVELERVPPPSCRAKVPGWLRKLGVRIGCDVTRGGE